MKIFLSQADGNIDYNCIFQARSSKSNRDLKDPDIAMAVALSRSIADEKMESRLSREEKLVALGLENIVEEDRKVSPLMLPPPDSGNATFLCIAISCNKRENQKQILVFFHSLPKSLIGFYSYIHCWVWSVLQYMYYYLCKQ